MRCVLFFYYVLSLWAVSAGYSLLYGVSHSLLDAYSLTIVPLIEDDLEAIETCTHVCFITSRLWQTQLQQFWRKHVSSDTMVTSLFYPSAFFCTGFHIGLLRFAFMHMPVHSVYAFSGQCACYLGFKPTTHNLWAANAI